MSCSFCLKTIPKQASNHVCDLAPNSNRVAPDQGVIREAECDEQYREDELQEHRATSMARSVFQCIVCAGKYTSKEGLWNHLDQHEIADKSKHLNFKERRVTHKLLTCGLCNDQRGYRESLFRKHVHEVHAGFEDSKKPSVETDNLQVDMKLNCLIDSKKASPGKNSVTAIDKEVESSSKTSQKQRKESSASIPEDHYGESSTATVKQECVFCIICGMPFANVKDLQHHKLTCFQHTSKIATPNLGNPSDMISIDYEHVAIKCEEDTTENMLVDSCDITIEETSLPVVDNSMSESSRLMCPHCDKYFINEDALFRHAGRSHIPVVCTICGLALSSGSQYRYHKLLNHSDLKFQCPYCPRKHQTKYQYKLHLSTHKEYNRYPCKICGKRYKDQYYVRLHMQRIHGREGDLKKTKESSTARSKQQEKTSDGSLVQSSILRANPPKKPK